jgi:hypothetical protein
MFLKHLSIYQKIFPKLSANRLPLLDIKFGVKHTHRKRGRERERERERDRERDRDRQTETKLCKS